MGGKGNYPEEKPEILDSTSGDSSPSPSGDSSICSKPDGGVASLWMERILFGSFNGDWR
jgi:hypothetical protein